MPSAGPVLVRLGSANVAQWIAPAYDAQRTAATCKPWHRVFALDGRQLTKDLGGDFPHHRGLFVGWNQVRSGRATWDFWHCARGESQRVIASRFADDGSHHEAEIDWCGSDGAAVVHERRCIAAVAIDERSYALDVDLELRAARDGVRLGGDPHHAGCQLRAAQAFAAADGPKARFVRPANASGGKDDVWTGCAWLAAVLPFADGEVTVLRIEHAANPPATWSARPYGRFGAMCTAELRTDAPLRLRMRWVIAAGARDAAWCEAAATAYRPSRQ